MRRLKRQDVVSIKVWKACIHKALKNESAGPTQPVWGQMTQCLEGSVHVAPTRVCKKSESQVPSLKQRERLPDQVDKEYCWTTL